MIFCPRAIERTRVLPRLSRRGENRAPSPGWRGSAETPGVKQPGNFRVRLPEFVSWAMSIWDNLPAELAERAKAVPEVEEAPAQGSVEKPLGTTERNTLLTIIAALCDYSAIDPKGRGTAIQIAKLTEEIGAPVSDDAIRKALAKLTDALETRKK
jgi:hypothetical protein